MLDIDIENKEKVVMPEIEEIRNELYLTQKQNEELRGRVKMLEKVINDNIEQLNAIRYILKR